MDFLDGVDRYEILLAANQFDAAVQLRQSLQWAIDERTKTMTPEQYLQVPWSELTRIGLAHPQFSLSFRRRVFAEFARGCKLSLTDFLLKCLRAPPLIEQSFLEGDWAAFWYLPAPSDRITTQTNLTKPIEKAWLNLRLLECIITACNWRFNPDSNEVFAIRLGNYQGRSELIRERLEV